MLNRFFLFFVLLFAAHSANAEDPVRIASGEYPPWASKDLPSGGFINLVVKAAFKEEGIHVEFDYLPWNRALEATKVGIYVASSFWGYDSVREPDFLHSHIIFRDPVVLFYNRNRTQLPPWDTLESLSGSVFGATRGYTYSDGFWQMAEQDILRVSVANDDITNLRKLIDGQIDLFPISRPTGLYLLNRNFTKEESANIRFDTKPINSSLDYLLFTRAKPEGKVLMEKFNAGLAKLKSEGRIDTMLSDYMETCCSGSSK